MREYLHMPWNAWKRGHPRMQRSPDPWIRRNAVRLGEETVAKIRRQPHLTDLDLPKPLYQRLIWSGHRWAGEFAHLSVGDVVAVVDYRPTRLTKLQEALQRVGIEIGQDVGHA